MASNLNVILGAMELGRRKLVEDQPVSVACSVQKPVHHGGVFLCSTQCFELLDSFLGRGYAEIDTALMYVWYSVAVVPNAYAFVLRML